MSESKIALTDRLRAEGRWDEASKFRDDQRRRLRTEGKSKTEAVEESWGLVAEKYPPVPTAPVDDLAHDVLDDESLDALCRPRQSDLTQDVLWVYGNLDNHRAKATDAPCLGAWSMLRWARSNQQRFFEQMLPKVMARHDARSQTDLEAEDEGDEGLQSLKQYLATFADKQ